MTLNNEICIANFYITLEEEFERVACMLLLVNGLSAERADLPLFFTLNKETKIEKMIMITAVHT